MMGNMREAVQLAEHDPDWRELTMPRMMYAPGHEPPPDNPEDFLRYGMSTDELHWKRKKAEMMAKVFPPRGIEA